MANAFTNQTAPEPSPGQIFAAHLREAAASTPGIAPDAVESILTSELWGSTVAIPFELRTPADVDAIQPFLVAKLTLK